MQYTTFKDIPQSQIEEWKSKFPVYLVEVTLDEEEIDGPKAKFILRPMSVAQQNAFAEFAQQKGTSNQKIQETLFKTVVLGGDMEHVDFSSEDARVVTAVLKQYSEIVDKKKATLTRL